MLRLHGFLSGIHQQEAAGAVGVLGLTGFNAHLAEQGRLLVSRNTGDRDAAFAVAVNLRGGPYLRQHLAWNIQHLQHFFIPFQGMNIEEQGARGVGVVGDVNLAAGEFPDQPAINGAEQQLAFACALSAAFDVIENPLELGAGEVGVGDQPCRFLDVVFQSVTLELLTDFGAAAALPDNRVVDRAAGFFFPYDGGFPLIGDADGRNLIMMQISLGECLGHARGLGGEDFHGVMFDPSRLRVMLDELALRGTDHVGIAVENNGA